MGAVRWAWGVTLGDAPSSQWQGPSWLWSTCTPLVPPPDPEVGETGITAPHHLQVPLMQELPLPPHQLNPRPEGWAEEGGRWDPAAEPMGRVTLSDAQHRQPLSSPEPLRRPSV